MVRQPILSLCFSHLSIVQQRRALDDLSIEPKGSIYLKTSIAHTKIVLSTKLKNKTRVKCEEATIPKLFVVRYTRTHSHSTYYLLYKYNIYILCILFTTVINFFYNQRCYTILVFIFYIILYLQLN